PINLIGPFQLKGQFLTLFLSAMVSVLFLTIKHSQFMEKLLHALGMIGKYYLYGFVFQLFFLNLMHAEPTKGQSSLDIKEVNLSLDLQGASLSESFSKIQTLTEFSFIYDQKLADKALPVNLQVNNQSLESILLTLSASHQLSF